VHGARVFFSRGGTREKERERLSETPPRVFSRTHATSTEIPDIRAFKDDDDDDDDDEENVRRRRRPPPPPPPLRFSSVRRGCDSADGRRRIQKPVLEYKARPSSHYG